MKCIHCGKEIPDNSIFCPLCGSKLTESINSDSHSEQNAQKAGEFNAKEYVKREATKQKRSAIIFIALALTAIFLCVIAKLVYDSTRPEERMGVPVQTDESSKKTESTTVSSNHIDTFNDFINGKTSAIYYEDAVNCSFSLNEEFGDSSPYKISDYYNKLSLFGDIQSSEYVILYQNSTKPILVISSVVYCTEYNYDIIVLFSFSYDNESQQLYLSGLGDIQGNYYEINQAGLLKVIYNGQYNATQYYNQIDDNGVINYLYYIVILIPVPRYDSNTFEIPLNENTIIPCTDNIEIAYLEWLDTFSRNHKCAVVNYDNYPALFEIENVSEDKCLYDNYFQYFESYEDAEFSHLSDLKDFIKNRESDFGLSSSSSKSKELISWNNVNVSNSFIKKHDDQVTFSDEENLIDETQSTDSSNDISTTPDNNKNDLSTISNEEIIERARKLSGAPCADLDHITDDGLLVIHLYENLPDHIATWDWYTIDPVTLTGYDFLEDPIDLNNVTP